MRLTGPFTHSRIGPNAICSASRPTMGCEYLPRIEAARYTAIENGAEQVIWPGEFESESAIGAGVKVLGILVLRGSAWSSVPCPLQRASLRIQVSPKSVTPGPTGGPLCAMATLPLTR